LLVNQWERTSRDIEALVAAGDETSGGSFILAASS